MTEAFSFDIVFEKFDIHKTIKFPKGLSVVYGESGSGKKHNAKLLVTLLRPSEQLWRTQFGISRGAAELASSAGIPHASVISASGANSNGWAPEWIHPLLYAKTIGQKEETLTKHFSFKNVTIFRPGMLIRHYDGESAMQRFFNSSSLGLPVSLLASAMKRDDIGLIAEGKIADLLVVDGDPSKDVTILGDKNLIKHVFLNGKDIDLAPAPKRFKDPDGWRISAYSNKILEK